MVKKTIQQRQDMQSTKPLSASTCLKQDVLGGRLASEPAVFQPFWKDDDDASLDCFLEKSKPQRPCYKLEGDCEGSLMENSVSSFSSQCMMDEDPAKTQQRRTRLEMMKVDRLLLATMELQNKALEQDRKKGRMNRSLNTFLHKQRHRVTGFGESHRGPSLEHPSSPNVRPRVSPAKFLQSLHHSCLKNGTAAWDLDLSEPDLPSVCDLDEEEEKPEAKVSAAERQELPVLLEVKETWNFDVGRGRTGTKTIRQTGQGPHPKARSFSPTGHHSLPPRSSRLRRFPTAEGIHHPLAPGIPHPL